MMTAAEREEMFIWGKMKERERIIALLEAEDDELAIELGWAQGMRIDEITTIRRGLIQAIALIKGEKE
jgi:hypothetical protein